jgi:hypothetical protein
VECDAILSRSVTSGAAEPPQKKKREGKGEKKKKKGKSTGGNPACQAFQNKCPTKANPSNGPTVHCQKYPSSNLLKDKRYCLNNSLKAIFCEN